MNKPRLEHETSVSLGSNVAISHDGRLVLATSNDGLLLWLPDIEAQPRVIPTNSSSAPLAVTTDGSLAIYAEILTDTLEVWDVQKKEHCFSLAGHSGYIDQISVSPQGRLVAASGDLGVTTSIWELDSGKLINTLNTGPVSAMSITSDGTRLVAASDHAIKLWNVILDAAQSRITAHQLPVTALAVSGKKPLCVVEFERLHNS